MPNHRLLHLVWNVRCKLQKDQNSKILSSAWVVDIKKKKLQKMGCGRSGRAFK